MVELEFLKKNNFLEAVDSLKQYEDQEAALRSLVVKGGDEYRPVLIALMLEIAYRKNTSFWFENIAYFYALNLDLLEGAQKTSLFYFVKAHKLNMNSEEILEAILDFQLPPEKILSNEEAVVYANKLIVINPDNERALKIIAADDND